MSKITDALATLEAADKSVTWDTSGECIVVTTQYFEPSGKSAGTVVRHFNDDQPVPEVQVIGAEDVGDVTVALTGQSATAEGAKL